MPLAQLGRDPEIAEQAYSETLALSEQVQPFAPPGLVAQVATSFEGLETISTALDDVGWDVSQFDPAVLSAIEEEQARAGFDINRYNFEICGIENGFDPADDPALVFGEATPSQVDTVRDASLGGLVDAGFTREEAECLLDRIDFADPDAFTDTEALLAIFIECGMSIDRLAEIGG